jgi:phosphohistidine phosphatase
MKTLYLLRHAKAEPGAKDISDPDRKLSVRGREACDLMGAYMKEKAYLPDLVLCSPSKRTTETLERVVQTAGIRPASRREEALYLATAEDILRVIRTGDDSAASVMVIGHNPGMHHIALLLCEPQRSKLRAVLELKFPTCAFAALRFDCEGWAELGPAEGTLMDFVTPGDL